MSYRRRLMSSKKYGIEWHRKMYVSIGTVTNKTRIDIDVVLYSWLSYEGFFNYGQSNWDFTRYSNATRSRWGGETLAVVATTVPGVINKPTHIILSMNKGVTSVNGTVYFTHTQKNFTKSGIILGNDAVGFVGKLYSFTIWEDNVLIDIFEAKNIDGVDCFVGKNTKEVRNITYAN